MIEGFDPTFDDTTWTLDWLRVPIQQVPPGEFEHGYRVVREFMYDFEAFGQYYQLDQPLDVRALLDPNGVLWMSDTPQERMMMWNNAGLSYGNVLVGGAGLALYPQYVTNAQSFTIIERSPIVVKLVAPIMQQLQEERGVPVRFVLGDVETYLTKAEPGSYNTIFLDTWPQLDAAQLPHINRLREDSARHLAPDGRVLLWGYHWMVRLFQEACATLLMIPPEERDSWLNNQLGNAPDAHLLLVPVVEAFAGETVQRWELDAAVAECRDWVLEAMEGEL
ncbi:MAG: class I SAM-dependent methyltransferase [Anaerolineae bacterium]|nr:class I SAM-dependent methyltransferase [Anaerolineae bacterium]